jgi:2-C-methyl-D-erythritol 2,4-cyclodiphosphate synthase
MNIGFGYDIHRLGVGAPFILGGVRIKHASGPIGHSDADVLIHAIMDALLGAAGLNDIGHLFPNTDPKYKNISSLKLLKKVAEKIRAAKFSINNVDATVVLEQPKVAPHINKIKANLSETLGIRPKNIGIKATTNEGIGFIGRGEGVAALAVASLEKVQS